MAVSACRRAVAEVADDMPGKGFMVKICGEYSSSAMCLSCTRCSWLVV